MILKLGENLTFNIPELLKLLDALEDNYQIYAQQIIKKKIETGQLGVKASQDNYEDNLP